MKNSYFMTYSTPTPQPLWTPIRDTKGHGLSPCVRRVVRYPVFMGAPVFQPPSPASQNETTRETKSPVFHKDHTPMATMQLTRNYSIL